MNKRALAALGVAAILSAACRLPGQAPAPAPNPTPPEGAASASPALPEVPDMTAGPATSTPVPGSARSTAPALPAPPVSLPRGLPAGFPLLPGQVVVAVNRPSDPTGLMIGVAPARGTVAAGLLEAGRLLAEAGYDRVGFTESGPSAYRSGSWYVEVSSYAGLGQQLVGYRVMDRQSAPPGAGSDTSGGSGGSGGIVVPPGFGGNGGVAGP